MYITQFIYMLYIHIYFTYIVCILLLRQMNQIKTNKETDYINAYKGGLSE